MVPDRDQRQWSLLARPPSVQPVIGQAARSRPYPSRAAVTWAGWPSESKSALGRGPTYGRSGCGLQRTLTASPVPVNLGGLGGIQQETAEMGKDKADAVLQLARKHAWLQIIFSSILFSGCNVDRWHAGRVRAKWWPPLVAALC